MFDAKFTNFIVSRLVDNNTSSPAYTSFTPAIYGSELSQFWVCTLITKKCNLGSKIGDLKPAAKSIAKSCHDDLSDATSEPLAAQVSPDQIQKHRSKIAAIGANDPVFL